ncbi:hypothetical protein PFZ55_41105 [Streptomyces sp. MS2A]|nr:hypothetical protein [Streptomyces sp. MS2A]
MTADDAHDRLDQIAELLKQPRDYYDAYQRPIKADFESQFMPITEAIELLAAEVRELRDRL